MKFFNLVLAMMVIANLVLADCKLSSELEAPSKLAHFVMFYLSNCSCGLNPTWTRYMEDWNENFDYGIEFSNVDCKTNEILCSHYNIYTYPTLIVFKNNNETKIKLTADDSGKLIEFIFTQLNKIMKKHRLIPKVSNKLNILSEENARYYLSKGNHLVIFYAPWDNRSRRLIPILEKVASNFDHMFIHFSKVDCTINEYLCEQYKIPTYPRILWIKDGKMIDDCIERNYDSLVAYVEFALKFLNPNNSTYYSIQ